MNIIYRFVGNAENQATVRNLNGSSILNIVIKFIVMHAGNSQVEIAMMFSSLADLMCGKPH